MNMSDKLNVLMNRNNIKNPKELSEKLDERNLKIPYTTLLTIINNEVQDIKLGTARKLCDFFHITLDDLLDDEIELADFKFAQYEGLDLEGLTEDDIKEINQYVEFKKNQRKKQSGGK